MLRLAVVVLLGLFVVTTVGCRAEAELEDRAQISVPN